MKNTSATGWIAVLFMTVGLAGFSSAGEQLLTPVSVFEAKDFPEPAPGKPAWKGTSWFSGVCVFDKWVYTVSAAGYVLQFERDPATAKMEYKGATPFGFSPKGDSGINNAFIRKQPDGNVLMYFEFGDHDAHDLVWYAIDKTTGKPAFKGKQAPVVGHVWWCYHYVAATDRIYGMVSRGAKPPLATRHFDENGATVEDGRVTTLGQSNFGWLVVSPDGRNIYQTNGKNVDAYTCDPKSGSLTFLASVETGAVTDYISPVSPDGRHLYLFGGTTVTVLTRDTEKGTLTVAPSSPADQKFKRLPGSEWTRHSRFAYSADGKSGGFIILGGLVGSFTRDQATGALTISATTAAAPQGVSHIAVDPATGQFFTAGVKIISFKP